ncbi:MAG TPA: hypothetical protein VFG74_17025 [Miltoncostaeaceae bacterium]|jgi:hypothetical protein|nr:hypothetical protein [Miltoncostaeaceae bacterium]
MTHRHHHGRGRRCGAARGPFGMRSFNREEWLARLEEYQRDLEQRTADVADLIRRLRQDPAPETAEA